MRELYAKTMYLLFTVYVSDLIIIPLNLVGMLCHYYYYQRVILADTNYSVLAEYTGLLYHSIALYKVIRKYYAFILMAYYVYYHCSKHVILHAVHSVAMISNEDSSMLFTHCGEIDSPEHTITSDPVGQSGI